MSGEGGELGAPAIVIFELNSFHLGFFGMVHSNTTSTGKAYFGEDDYCVVVLKL